MSESGKQDIILMWILTVTKDDLLACANELGMSEEQVTDDVIDLVKERFSPSLLDWPQVIKDIVKDAFNCPLGIVCSPSCVWREAGQCTQWR